MAYEAKAPEYKTLSFKVEDINRALHLAVPLVVVGFNEISRFLNFKYANAGELGGVFGSLAASKPAKKIVNKHFPLPGVVGELIEIKNKAVDQIPLLNTVEIILKTSLVSMVAPTVMGLANAGGLANMSKEVLTAFERKDPVAIIGLITTGLITLDVAARLITKLNVGIKAFKQTEFYGLVSDWLLKRTDYEDATGHSIFTLRNRNE